MPYLLATPREREGRNLCEMTPRAAAVHWRCYRWQNAQLKDVFRGFLSYPAGHGRAMLPAYAVVALSVDGCRTDNETDQCS